MKILYHGTVVRFECDSCGCRFQAGVKECESIMPFECICPDCGMLVGHGKRAVNNDEPELNK